MAPSGEFCTEKRLPLLVVSALFFMLLVPKAGFAQATLTSVQLLVFDNREGGVAQGWTFEVEIKGTAMISASVTPPEGDPIALLGGATERQYESAVFASFETLQASFPPSDPTNKYVISVNGDITLNLDFDPVAPDGAGVWTFPIHEGGTANLTPTFVVDGSACTNCNVQVIHVDDQGGNEVNLEQFEIDTAFSTSLAIEDFEKNDPEITELVLGTYEACLSMANGMIIEDFSSGGQTFDWTAAAVAEDCIYFGVVPLPDVHEVELDFEYRHHGGAPAGWYFAVFVIGQDLLAGTITPPRGAAEDLPVDFDELGFSTGPFASFAAAQAAYPPSDAIDKYLLSLNGGVATVSLDFDPVEPAGGIVVVNPGNGATTGSQPTFTVSNSCGECDGQIVDIYDDFGEVDLEAEWFVSPPSTIPFAAFEPNEGSLGPLTELPLGDYTFQGEVYVESETEESFTPADSFTFFAGTFVTDAIAFTVPEPGSAWLHGAALLSLVVLRRRRRPGMP